MCNNAQALLALVACAGAFYDDHHRGFEVEAYLVHDTPEYVFSFRVWCYLVQGAVCRFLSLFLEGIPDCAACCVCGMFYVAAVFKRTPCTNERRATGKLVIVNCTLKGESFIPDLCG